MIGFDLSHVLLYRHDQVVRTDSGEPFICVNSVDQFQIHVPDLVGGSGRSLSHGSSSAVRFFTTHQVKVSIRLNVH